ncbi:MAG: 5'/3'-nucleotidase SurE [Casimicrobiaceae bacterium]
MRILICNDDGTGAPGLELMATAARSLCSDIWVVAPACKWTAASHQISFDRVLTLTRAGERNYACSGAPADCVVAAMTLLFADGGRPDLVLAGVNDKINVAEDIAYSGTMAIAREATFWGVPAIGVSRDLAAATGTRDADAAAIGRVLRLLWEQRAGWAAAGHWLSLNLPSVLPAALQQAEVGHDKIGGACEVVARSAEQISYKLVRGRPRTSTPGDERSIVAAGRIALVRQRWHADTPLAVATVGGWNAGLA